MTSDTLTKFQQGRKQSTEDAVIQAMKDMKAEIVLAGFYLENNGKVTLAEVLKRAGVGPSTLRNNHHHELRDKVQTWLDELKERFPVTTEGVRSAGREKIANYELAMRKMGAEVVVLRHEKAADAREKAALRATVDKVKKQLRDVARQDSTNVIIFPETS